MAPVSLAVRMKRGDQFYAGMGVATVLAECDFETRSEAGFVWDSARNKWSPPKGATKKGLPAVAAARYAEHPTTDIQLFAYDLKDGLGARQWVPGMPAPLDLFDHLARGELIEAHNVMFERLIWWHVAQRRYGWPEVRPEQWRCSMAKARAHALPGALGLIGDVLDLPIKKDKEGDGLIKFFAIPRDPTKANPKVWNEPAEHPDKWASYARYNAGDVAAEAEVSIRCPDLTGEELAFWQADQAINWRGVHIDRAGVDNCIAIIEQAHEVYNAELRALTGGAVNAASELAKLKGWLGAFGVIMGDGPGSMDDDAIEDALKRPDLPPHCRRALEIRQAIGSASVKKVFAMANQACDDDRLRDLFSYHAARTGRPTGNGPQPTNLPKAGPTVYRCDCGRHGADPAVCRWCGAPRAKPKALEWNVEAVEDALAVIALRDLRTLEHYFGDAMLTVSGCLRGLFTAAPFHDLIASDYTAIEAVVLAALAGEDWRLDVFRAKRDIYLESISRSTGIPLEELVAYKATHGMHHPQRQRGKIQELALGFGGWIGALRAFGAEGTDRELQDQVLAWRAASPAVVEFWGGQTRDFGRDGGDLFGLEGMVILAMRNPGQEFHVMRLNGTHSGISYVMRDDALYCRLPSGRYLTYHRPRLRDTGNWRGYEISFEGYNTNPKSGPIGWIRMTIYSGKFCENVVQATARDIQRNAIVNLERRGYPVVLHVYDEDVGEVPQGWGSIEEFESTMNDLPEWAKGWPISASGGWRGKRYRKA